MPRTQRHNNEHGRYVHDGNAEHHVIQFTEIWIINLPTNISKLRLGGYEN